MEPPDVAPRFGSLPSSGGRRQLLLQLRELAFEFCLDLVRRVDDLVTHDSTVPTTRAAGASGGLAGQHLAMQERKESARLLRPVIPAGGDLLELTASRQT